METKNEDEIRTQLASLVNFLNMHSLFVGDDPSWAADCIESFLDGREKTLDHAFGLRTSKRGPKHMESGKHDEWVAAAYLSVIEKKPKGKEWPSTKDLADIGRFHGLGGENNEDAEDHAIASELKKILKRYNNIALEQLSKEINVKMDETKK